MPEILTINHVKKIKKKQPPLIKLDVALNTGLIANAYFYNKHKRYDSLMLEQLKFVCDKHREFNAYMERGE